MVWVGEWWVKIGDGLVGGCCCDGCGDCFVFVLCLCFGNYC